VNWVKKDQATEWSQPDSVVCQTSAASDSNLISHGFNVAQFFVDARQFFKLILPCDCSVHLFSRQATVRDRRLALL
jgi:hypothetical protein